MTREEAIEIAKKYAYAESKKQGAANYLQLSDHPDWMPHEWVIEAILSVANEH